MVEFVPSSGAVILVLPVLISKIKKAPFPSSFGKIAEGNPYKCKMRHQRPLVIISVHMVDPISPHQLQKAISDFNF